MTSSAPIRRISQLLSFAANWILPAAQLQFPGLEPHEAFVLRLVFTLFAKGLTWLADQLERATPAETSPPTPPSPAAPEVPTAQEDPGRR